MAQQFDAVSLDVGGVLVVPDHGVLGGVLDRGGDRARPRAGSASATTWPWRPWTRPRPIRRTSPTTCGASSPPWPCPTRTGTGPTTLLDAVLRTPVWCQPVAGSRLGLRALADAGLRLAVTSNSDGTVADHLAPPRVGAGRRRARACRWRWSPTRASSASASPTRGVFQATIDGLGLPPERILHIGDSVHYDVDGGAAVGMQAVHMDPFGVCGSTDHPHVRTLAELLDLGLSALGRRLDAGTVGAMFS